jgi:hypothetical protein
MSDSKLNIKYACDQKWCSMKLLNDTTRYCSHCDKDISDFSLKDNFDTREIYCGHFSLSQVNSIQRHFTIRNVSALTFSLLSLLGAMAVPQQSNGQSQTKHSLASNPKGGKIKLSGLVKEKNTNEGIPFAVITAKTTDSIVAQTVTDIDGKFVLAIDTSLITLDKIQIEFECVGYNQDTLRIAEIPKDLLKKEITISLEAGLPLNLNDSLQYYLTGRIDVGKWDKEQHKKNKKSK